MATKKQASNQGSKKSKIILVAEKVGTIAGTVVAKKNQLLKKAEAAIDTAKQKVHAFTAKKIPAEKKAAEAKVKKVVKKAVKKAATATAAAKKSARKAAKKTG
jgi:hypothetical protein